MFKYCKHVNRVCEFSVDSEYCGIGKGDGKIDYIQSCNGKNPVYSKSFIRKIKDLEKIHTMKASGEW